MNKYHEYDIGGINIENSLKEDIFTYAAYIFTANLMDTYMFGKGFY